MPNQNLDRHVLIRMIQIDKQIRAGKYPNASKLAKHFELSPRTLQRDIEAMRDFLGADIQYDPVKNGYFYPPGAAEIIPGVKLTDEERFILQLSEAALPEITTGSDKVFKSLLQKLYLADAMARTGQTDICDKLSFDFGKPMQKSGEQAFKLIKKAIQNKQTLDITYYTTWSRKRTERLFDPYHIRWTSSSWVVIGFCHLRNDMRVFAVSNIEEIKLTKQHFEIAENYSTDNFLGNAWGIIKGDPVSIKLKFSEEMSEWIAQRKWHKTQKIHFEKDGALIMELTVDGLSEITSWILGWGSNVEVLEPKELRAEILKEAKKLGELYKSE